MVVGEPLEAWVNGSAGVVIGLVPALPTIEHEVNWLIQAAC